jgi:nitronate monooxygenase
MLSFGDPAPYAKKVKSFGIKLICQVPTKALAQQALDAGADVIIAQGRDAGGHGGSSRGTISLVPAIVDIAGAVPVVAAGGLADGRGLAAALMLGASGVLMGTRFAASRESLWSNARKEMLLSAEGDGTLQTRVFDIVQGLAWPKQLPGRALANRFSSKWHGNEEKLELLQSEEEKSYSATGADDFETRVVWAGEVVDLVREVLSAKEIVERIVDEAVQSLRCLSNAITE